MRDRHFLQINPHWSLASDGLQWILRRHHTGGVNNLSFVRSSRDVLARCMRERGIPADDIKTALAKLPETFHAWLESHHDQMTDDFQAMGQSDTGRTAIAARLRLIAKAA
jgi:hypothetical protein